MLRTRLLGPLRNIVNYWCAPESPDWKGWGVGGPDLHVSAVKGSFIECVEAIHFRARS